VVPEEGFYRVYKSSYVAGVKNVGADLSANAVACPKSVSRSLSLCVVKLASRTALLCEAKTLQQDLMCAGEQPF